MNKILYSIGLIYLSSTSVFAGNYNESNIQQYSAPIAVKHTTESQKKGLEIYKKQYLIDEDWKDTESAMSMVLIDALGRKSKRTVIKRTMEENGKPDKTMGIFLEPKDVKGTIMLTYEHSFGADSQWLYLPSLKRTKKINAQNKSGSFVGTEFSWEDISATELTKYTYDLLGEDANSWKIEKKPTYQYSGYSKLITWVDKKNYQTTKIDYFDKNGKLLKTQVFGGWKKINNKSWRPLTFTMTNYQNKKKTILSMSPYKVSQGFTSNQFSSLGLRKISQQRF